MVWPWSPIQKQIDTFFPPDMHPYVLLERAIDLEIQPTSTVLDVGCGRTAPQLRALRGQAGKLFGVDIVEFSESPEGIELIQCGVENIPMEDGTVDLAYSRAVMEHIGNIEESYQEVFRVLKSGGCYIFITPSIYDYGSLIASIVPNRWHHSIVRFTEGRQESDVFPTFYRSNSKRQVLRLAASAGFRVERLSYLGQYPSYLGFSRPLFYLGCLYGDLLRRIPALSCLQGWLYCVLRKP